MNTLFLFLELFATLVEGYVFIAATTLMSGMKYPKIKSRLLISGIACLYTIITTCMNQWKAFSFFTLLVGYVFIVLTTRFISTGKLLLRCTTCILVYFVFNTLDYILGYGSAMIIGHSIDIQQGFNIIMQPNLTRAIYILINKLLQIGVFLGFKPLYQKMQLLNKRYLAVLFCFFSIAYVLMSSMTALIMSDSRIILQIAVILSLLFILISMIAIILTVFSSYQIQLKKKENDLMVLSNSLMEKNYQSIQHNQNLMRLQMHDFKNHIRTIDGLLVHDEAAKAYIRELIDITYNGTGFCACGNEIIDAIINCKQMDAASYGIDYSYQIKLPYKLPISSINICAILANQIDNAIEACQRMDTTKKRFIHISIFQRESFVFFIVENSTDVDPFDEKHELISSKTQKTGMHGLGIKIIKEALRNYDGELKNTYKDGLFTSTAMLQINT